MPPYSVALGTTSQTSGSYTVGSNSYDRQVAGTYGTLYLNADSSGTYSEGKKARTAGDGQW